MTLIGIGRVELDEPAKIAVASEEAFEALLDSCTRQGLRVANVPFEQMTADGAAASLFQTACAAMVARLQQIAPPDAQLGQPAKDLNPPKTKTPIAIAAPVRTFHVDGAIELRCTVLHQEKRVDVHIIDLEGVIDAAEQQGLAPSWADGLLEAIDELVENHEDGGKLEITPQDLQGNGKPTPAGPFPPGVAVPGAAAADLPNVDRDQRR